MNPVNKHFVSIKSQMGVGLIEVMVAVLILGTALLTLTSLQTKSLQFNQSAYLRSQASILAYDIIDRMRVNRDQASSYEIDFAEAAPAGSSLTQLDLTAWLRAVSVTLPNGQGDIKCDASQTCTVQLRWIEQLTGNDGQNREAVFSYTSRL